MPLTFDSASDLARALRRAEAAHGRHEAELGHPDADWPTWYAQFLEREQAEAEEPEAEKAEAADDGAPGP
jgi:hypothetical protein